jgi:hypothetical protein
MRRVFLSHSFAERDRVLVSQVEALIRSHGLIATNGRTLGGGPLTPEIAGFIEETDAMVALLTLRDNDPGNITHPWVQQELGHARLLKKPAIGLYERGVPVQGADAGYEHVDYDPGAPHLSFIELSETLGEWKRRAGRLFKVQVMPDDVARSLGTRADRVRCECRFQIDGNETEWQDVRIRREIGGVFVYLRVPDAVEMIQLRTAGPPPCESAYTPLSMPIRLDPSA